MKNWSSWTLSVWTMMEVSAERYWIGLWILVSDLCTSPTQACGTSAVDSLGLRRKCIPVLLTMNKDCPKSFSCLCRTRFYWLLKVMCILVSPAGNAWSITGWPGSLPRMPTMCTCRWCPPTSFTQQGSLKSLPGDSHNDTRDFLSRTSPRLHLAYGQRQAGELQRDENFAGSLHLIKWIQLSSPSRLQSWKFQWKINQYLSAFSSRYKCQGQELFNWLVNSQLYISP